MTQDPDALLPWSVVGPEVVRVISEFESSTGRKTRNSSSRHHAQSNANHRRVAAQVKSLVGVMTDTGNPFEEESADLLRLHSRDIMDKAYVECLTTIQCRGEDQYRLFVSERLLDRSKPLSVPVTYTISRNKVRLFN